MLPVPALVSPVPVIDLAYRDIAVLPVESPKAPTKVLAISSAATLLAGSPPQVAHIIEERQTILDSRLWNIVRSNQPASRAIELIERKIPICILTGFPVQGDEDFALFCQGTVPCLSSADT